MENSSKRDRRLVQVPVGLDWLLDAIRQGHILNNQLECVEGIPQDAIFVGAVSDHVALSVYFVFYHPSFDVVPVSEAPPTKHALFRYRNSHFLNLVSSTIPELTKALVESLDDNQLKALRRILVLVGSSLPEGDKPGPIVEALAEQFAFRIQQESHVHN